jgi:Double-GTPase 1
MIPSVVVIGIPESGKSSFIAALSHILEFREIDTELTLAQLPDEAQYLFEMRNEWQGCRPFERTKAGSFHPIIFNLQDKSGDRVDLSFPDIAGEEFEEQWSTRIWNELYLKSIEQAYGVLLFINARTLRKPFSLADADKVKRSVMALLDGMEDDADQVDAAPEAEDSGQAIARQVSSLAFETKQDRSNPAVWEPRKADEQAKLVDILQSLVDFSQDRRWRLGIVVSAWDLVRKVDSKALPREWIEMNMPLLRQYLQSNRSSFEVETFGVSAQGGDPTSDAERLQNFDSQSERVLVVAKDYEGHDLTRVVAWLMGGHG